MICEYCEKRFESNNLKRKYCSSSCSARVSNKGRNRHKPKTLINKQCFQCDKNFTVTQSEQKRKFCSIECSSKSQRKSTVKQCLSCNKEFTGSVKRKYCSLQCVADGKWKEKVKLIESGSVTNHVAIRKYLLEKNGCRCTICGIEKWNGVKVPIIMDHIDGNSNNNKLDNLRLVCPNCDALLPTYKGRNRGNGRHTRINRYHNGRSF